MACFAIPVPGSLPGSITLGPDSNLSFTENGITADRIGRVTPSGVVTEFPLHGPGVTPGPGDIAAGPDGNLWFTEAGLGKIGRMSPAGVFAEFSVPSPASFVNGIAAGADGNVWFVESIGFPAKIGRITPAGVITEFPLPDNRAAPANIAAGPDGNLWFTETGTGKLGRITPAGAITETTLATSAAITDITPGPDGALWFTEPAANVIGRLSLRGASTSLAFNGTSAYAEAADSADLNLSGRNSILAGVRTDGQDYPIVWDMSYLGLDPKLWHHVAVTFRADLNVLNLWLDGKHISYLIVPGHSAVGNTLPLEIGRNGPATSKYWLGKLDDVRIWNVARKGADITANYKTQLDGPQPGLVANWHFDEGSGTAAADSSGNNHTATLNGGASFSTDVHP